jgi:hypothetical protein
VTTALSLFDVCPVPKCSNPVPDDEPCGECTSLIAAGIIRRAEGAPGAQQPPAADIPELHGRGEWEQERVARWQQAASRPEGHPVTHDLTKTDYLFQPAEDVQDCRVYCWSGLLPHPGDYLILRIGRYQVTTVDPCWGQYPACQWMAELESAPEVTEVKPAAVQERGHQYKANQHCWVCEQRRTCRLDPDQRGQWICKECEAVQ